MSDSPASAPSASSPVLISDDETSTLESLDTDSTTVVDAGDDVPVTLDTIAPNTLPVLPHTDPMITALADLQTSPTVHNADDWVRGPDFTYYPPIALLNDREACASISSGGHEAYDWPSLCEALEDDDFYFSTVSIFPAPHYAVQHLFKDALHTHENPWIPRPLVLFRVPTSPAWSELFDNVTNPVAVDSITRWRLLFDRFFKFKNCTGYAYWGGDEIIDLHLSELGRVAFRSCGLQRLICSVEVELHRLLCTLLPNFNPLHGSDPLTYLPRRAYQDAPSRRAGNMAAERMFDMLRNTCRVLSHGVFTLFENKGSATRRFQMPCQRCLAEPVPFFMSEYNWPEPWIVFMSSIKCDYGGITWMCTFCKMEYLHMLDEDHNMQMKGIAMLANRSLRVAHDVSIHLTQQKERENSFTNRDPLAISQEEIDAWNKGNHNEIMHQVPYYLRAVPKEIWQHIGKMAKEDVAIDNRLLRNATVYQKNHEGIVIPMANSLNDEMWTYHRRMHRWLTVTRKTNEPFSTCVHHAPVESVLINDESVLPSRPSVPNPFSLSPPEHAVE